tara:strand:+ start:356 stop:556 length:201 start_codon:yes stop_codon:yes gene_type:complete
MEQDPPLPEVQAVVVEQEEQGLITLEPPQTLVDLDLHPQLMAPLQPVVLVALVVVIVVNQRVLMEL